MCSIRRELKKWLYNFYSTGLCTIYSDTIMAEQNFF